MLIKGDFMIGRSKINALIHQYPEVLDKNTAVEYLLILDNLKKIDKKIISKKELHDGQIHSQKLLDFLKREIQFHSTKNLMLTLDDIIRWAQVCANYTPLKEYATIVSQSASQMQQLLLANHFKDFDFVNYEELLETNLQKAQEDEKQQSPGKENKKPNKQG